jgi:hypothetical protein
MEYKEQLLKLWDLGLNTLDIAMKLGKERDGEATIERDLHRFLECRRIERSNGASDRK